MKEFLSNTWNDFLYYLLRIGGGILAVALSIAMLVALWRFYSGQSRTGQQRILGFLLVLLSFFLLGSLLSGTSLSVTGSCWTGIAGNWISRHLFWIMGYGSFLLPVLGIVWGVNRLLHRGTEEIFVRTTFSLILLLSSLTMISFVVEHRVRGGFYPAGIVGENSGEYLTRALGRIGSFLLLIPVIAAAAIVCIGVEPVKRVCAFLASFFGSAAARVGRSVTGVFRKRLFSGREGSTVGTAGTGRRKPLSSISGTDEIPVSRRTTDEDTAGRISPACDERVARKEKKEREERQEKILPSISSKGESRAGDQSSYRYPPLTLLNEPQRSSTGESEEDLRKKARILEKKLSDFGVRARVVNISPGPVITRFEVEPSPGVKVNRIVSLADDLALALQSTRIRILAPIPGKGTVGVEVPNPLPSIVYLKEVLHSGDFKQYNGQLKFALGKSISGKLEFADLTRMPHLLIAGATGSGKSVCINSMLVSMLYCYDPSEVRFLMVDPKMLELTLYRGIPHLLSPVVTESKDVAVALRWAMEEMERRYRQLASLGVRGIDTFNRRVVEMKKIGEFAMDDTELERLPYIVIVIDELADLMLTVANEIEEPIARLAQMARAVGIHLVLATQRPSVNVITGVIKANFPSRIAFQVATKIDSRTIIDMNGAEKLLGMGDMLFMPAGRAEPIRIHGSYVSDAEIKRIVSYIRSQDISLQKLDFTTEESHLSLSQKERDPLFNEAMNLIVRHQQGSISLIQRRLKVGYARAARLIDQLEDAGIVGPFDGSKAREVLVDESYLEDFDGETGGDRDSYEEEDSGERYGEAE
jgi:hypothetical protein